MLALSTLAGEVQMVSIDLQDVFMEHSSPPPLPSTLPREAEGHYHWLRLAAWEAMRVMG